MTPEQNKIEKVLNVADTISAVPASDTLKHRLSEIPSMVREEYSKVPKKVIWAAAASIAILIVLNILSAKEYSSENDSNDSSSSYFNHLKTL